ncbi:MoaD/ThiS family protein [Candidatus Woesearchaeota archaeon]|nr:MoaD/ThiS family protein [Candidatus Woesearchaeota archaeon]
MKISVFIEKSNEKQIVELKSNSKVVDLLKTLNINPTTVLIARDSNIITEDVLLKDKDNIKILSVISGG